MSGDEIHEVRILGLPLDLWERTTAHHAGLQREFEIIRAGEPPDSLPNRLRRLIDEFDARFGPANGPTWAQVRRASLEGAGRVDVTFKVPGSAAGAARQLAGILAEVDEYCRSGTHLLSLASPPDIVAFREWLLAEFPRQIEEASLPTPWTDVQPAGDYADTALTHSSQTGPVVVRFSGPLDLTTAGDLRERIQGLRNDGAGEVIVDLSEVGFIDSIGVGLLVTTHTRLASEGMRMRLIAPRRLQELLRLSGLTDLLQPEDPPPG